MFVAMWMMIGSGKLTLLLIAAMDKQKKELCKGYEVKIKAEKTGEFFLDEAGIGKILKTSVKGEIERKNQRLDLTCCRWRKHWRRMLWIKDARLSGRQSWQYCMYQ